MKKIAFTELMVIVALAGCGGGGVDSPSGTAPSPTASQASSISGTAATGAPFANAAISIIDKTGNVVGSTTSGVDGSYTVTLSAGATGPFVLKAVRDDQTLVSVAPAANSTINITPITNLIASRLSNSGDPAKLADEFKANPNLLTSSSIDAKVNEVVTVLKPVLDAVGTSTNPLTGSFAANGTGADRALDSLSIKITPSSATTSNIEIAVKQVMADGAAPQTVQFSNVATTITPLPAVTATNLITPGTAPLIAALLAKMNACYALPVAERVDVPDTNGQKATNIKAAACKEIFYNNDPSTFKSSGRLVGSNGNTDAFASIFRSGGNNLVFDRGTYEFTRINGDIVIGYRATDSAGNVTYDTFAVRPDNVAAPTKLQQIGNQYDYDGAIKTYQQLRTFVNDPASDYYSTGYIAAVNNTLDSSNNPIFSKVVVTTPSGHVMTLKPKAGYGQLQLVKPTTPTETITGTNFLRLGRAYVSAAKAGQDPAAADTTLFFASPAWSDDQITAIPQQSVWKFDYYLANNSTTTPDATQAYRTRARAASIAELKQQPLANLTSDMVTNLVSASSGKGFFPVPAAGETINWEVGTGALPPTTVAVWGFVSNVAGSSFNDNLTVGSTKRSATIPCVPKSAGDVHCAAGSYVTGSQLDALHLWARDPVGREFAHLYATYSIGANGN